jgi:hydrogenase expression/formation protein HypD
VLAHVADAAVGDYVLVHVGFALARLDEAEATRIFALLAEMRALDELQDGLPDPTRTSHRHDHATAVPRRVTAIPDAARALAEAIRRACTRPWTLMEVCGGQTHAIVKYGLDELPRPGSSSCTAPAAVCVTPLEMIDRAHAIARAPTSSSARSATCCACPARTATCLAPRPRAPTCAWSTRRSTPSSSPRSTPSARSSSSPSASRPPRRPTPWRVDGEDAPPRNFSALVSHVLVPPRDASHPRGPDNRVQGFLGPGTSAPSSARASTSPSPARYRVPIVVTGLRAARPPRRHPRHRAPARGRPADVENLTRRVVRPDGKPGARSASSTGLPGLPTASWRGVGVIPMSGYRLRDELRRLRRRAPLRRDRVSAASPPSASAADPARLKKPRDCPAFGVRCTPDTPLGATMVSSEGACAAYLRLRTAPAAVQARA